MATRDLTKTSPNATRPTRRPGIMAPTVDDPGLARWIGQVTDYIQVLNGGATPFDKALTWRDLIERGIVTQQQVSNAPAQTQRNQPGVVINTGAGQTVVGFDQFAESIRHTKLYTDLTRRIDDPSRFDDLSKRTRDALLAELAPTNGAIVSSIRRVEESFSNAQEAFAQTVEELKAGVASASAGVREVRFASASSNRSTAGVVTQVQARLDNFTGGAPGTATVETKMTAIADRATGLEAQYVVKVAAGGAMAGIGLAATSGGVGGAAPTSAFIIQADKFAIVDSSYSGGLTTTPDASHVMFGVDTDGTYIKGNVKALGIATFQGGAMDPIAGGNAAILVNNQASGKAKFGAVIYGNGLSGSTALQCYNNFGAGCAGLVVSTGTALAITTGYAYDTSTYTGGGTAIRISSNAGTGIYFGAVGGSTATAINIADASSISWNSRTITAPAGSTSTFLRNDGSWADPLGPVAKGLVYQTVVTPSVLTIAGYMKVISTDGTVGPVAIAYYNLP